ncbi:MAG TPA: BatA domain-containing protein [Longimicrobiales bacterium]|nr:BatA domain-containing protein [Longimicrobiales bacterium]
MGFLAPALLAATLAVAVPIWLHLTRRPPERRQPFPSLAFLEEAPLQSTRRRALRHPLLLALRILAILLVVGAFARPYLNADIAGEAGPTGGRNLVLLLDRSYSMGGAGRMEAAREAARSVVGELREGDRLTLVAFDEGARPLGPGTRAVEALHAAIDSVVPGESGTSYAAALRLAESILEASPGPRREVVVVSDFAAAAPQAEPPVPLPAGTVVRSIPVGGDELDDLAVSDVSLRRSGFAAGERVNVVARVRNTGSVPVLDRPVTLTLDGSRVATAAVSAEPGASATAEFPPFSLASGAAAGAVRVAGDDLPANDVRYFVAEPRRAIDVLIVEPDGTGPRAGLHLRRALELGRAPTFALRRRTPRSLRGEDFAQAGVVILDGVPFPEDEPGDRLRAWVEAGGGLVVGGGERSGRGGGEAAEDLIPASSGRAVGRPEGATLGRIAYGHPIFAPFRDPGSGDLSVARATRYRRMEEAEGQRVLARFDDGAPALLEAEAGLGRVLVWTSSLGDAWNDLPLQPVYLPFVHRLVLHAAGWHDGSGDRRVGTAVDPDDVIVTDIAREEAPVLVGPDGSRRTLETAEPLPLERAGIYEVRDPAATATRRFAVNVDPAEAGTETVDTAGLAVVGPGIDAEGGPAGPEAETAAGGDREPGPALWWPLLLAAGVVFLVESVLSNAVPGRSMIGGTQ